MSRKKMTTIFRVIKDRNFTQIHNSILHNPKLTWKAKGLLSVMLSLPDTWDFHRDHLVTLSADGKHALASAIKELELHGYVRLGQERDSKGKIVRWVMEVVENPVSLAQQQVYPEPDYPHLDKQDLDNRPLSNTKAKSKTKNNKSAVVDSEINKTKKGKKPMRDWDPVEKKTHVMYSLEHIADNVPFEDYKNIELHKQIKFFIDARDADRMDERHAMNIALKLIKQGTWSIPKGYGQQQVDHDSVNRKYSGTEQLLDEAVRRLEADGIYEPDSCDEMTAYYRKRNILAQRISLEVVTH